MSGDVNELYWQEYDGLQNAKHRLLFRYLGGWFPILGFSHGTIMYVDTHAGRGRHDTGEAGSPILALELLLKHKAREKILQRSQIIFAFFEADAHNYAVLQTEIARLSTPPSVKVHPINADYESTLTQILDDIEDRGTVLAPSFFFIDPFGFRLSMQFLNRLLRQPKVELLINFMYRYVDMAMHKDAQEDNMDALFGSPDWRKYKKPTPSKERYNGIIELFSQQLQAEYVTHMNMHGENGGVKYVLFHATNHEKGRNLMKEAMWSVSPDGSFSAYERGQSNQLVLFELEPDITPLRRALFERYAGQSVGMREINHWLSHTLWLPKHLRQVLATYHNSAPNAFICDGRFGLKNIQRVIFP